MNVVKNKMKNHLLAEENHNSNVQNKSQVVNENQLRFAHNSFMERFKEQTKLFKDVQEVRKAIGNRIYNCRLIEPILRKSKQYLTVKEMRRDKSKAKETRRLIEKILKEEFNMDIKSKEFKEIFEKEKREDKYYIEFKKLEYQIQKELKEYLDKMPIYTEFLSKIDGINTLTGAQLICIIENIQRFPMVSSLWQYFGVGNPKTKLKKGEQAEYNPKYKALVLGVIGRNLIMKKSEYVKYYYKRKALTEQTHPEWTRKHRHNDARRIMVKQFLKDLWIKWNEIEHNNQNIYETQDFRVIEKEERPKSK